MSYRLIHEPLRTGQKLNAPVLDHIPENLFFGIADPDHVGIREIGAQQAA